jgi:hypothetical protein
VSTSRTDSAKKCGGKEKATDNNNGRTNLDNLVKALPVARCPANPAVNNQGLRVLGDLRSQCERSARGAVAHIPPEYLRVKVVHEHAQRRLGEPALARALRASWGTNRARSIKSRITRAGQSW